MMLAVHDDNQKLFLSQVDNTHFVPPEPHSAAHSPDQGIAYVRSKAKGHEEVTNIVRQSDAKI